MTFKDRLKIAMDEGGFTQASLAKATGLAQSMIWKLVSGNANGTSKLVSIAKVLGVRPEWLSEGSGTMRETENENKEQDRYTREPFFSVDIYDGDIKTNHLLMVPDLVRSESCRAYLLKEDTGCAETPAGTYIVVDSSESPGNNDLVYAQSGETTSVYRFVRGGAEDFLSVDDPRVPLSPAKSFEIKGVIVFLLRGLKRNWSKEKVDRT
ncbi:TPA: helix-turn-helix domain-containing protein [Yersinia enterocolitica]|uniref:helix-turn-helix domain-containing protein n=1 Tax=Yersinia TaxID=629 RepID=UPI0005E89295|nr:MULTISPECIES: helix-turn-helix transcriptional regulator [Yersinia]EKN3981852.1 helix-turn-helix transcriptional regulator [Yersinia enterocolitica]EKN6282914.1 XRE family transcriptional regulator [Yersinia enterocolitica]OVZ73807.1 transcriptional regulator [Yersinia intermedia]CQJ02439.1 repressor protein CI [Yersinia frederiksenii]HDL6704986.1 helix-turn-helix transcriptional regulator [Yersinia enterocolitica]